MSEDEALKLIFQAIKEETDGLDFNLEADTAFSDLGLDSLTAVELVFGVEDLIHAETGNKEFMFEFDELLALNSLGDMAKVASERLST